MRGVIAEVTDDWLTLDELATRIKTDPRRYEQITISRSTRQSMRRACKRLAEQGQVECAYRSWRDLKVVWTAPPGLGVAKGDFVVRRKPGTVVPVPSEYDARLAEREQRYERHRRRRASQL